MDKANSLDLPDLMTLSNRNPVLDPADWIRFRRPEIMSLLEDHQFGRAPHHSIQATHQLIERDAPILQGAALRTQARITFPETLSGPEIRVALARPARPETPPPVLLYLAFKPNLHFFDDPGIDEGLSWDRQSRRAIPDRDARHDFDLPIRQLVERGYGVATVYYGDIRPDFDADTPLGVERLFPAAADRTRPDAWGAISQWAWGASRVLDWLCGQPQIDASRVALAGVSRLGKAALWACATDTRFAMSIPWLAGKGGDSLLRHSSGETLDELTSPDRFHYWFAPQFRSFAGDVRKAPVDAHMLMAMIAPRPLLQIVGDDDDWADPLGAFLAAKAAEPVWRLFGRSGLPIDAFPDPDTPALADMGFSNHAGGHETLRSDFDVIADFMDHHLGAPGRN